MIETISPVNEHVFLNDYVSIVVNVALHSGFRRSAVSQLPNPHVGVITDFLNRDQKGANGWFETFYVLVEKAVITLSVISGPRTVVFVLIGKIDFVLSTQPLSLEVIGKFADICIDSWVPSDRGH